jgi:flagella basal body P-ring formation protein FlgA
VKGDWVTLGDVAPVTGEAAGILLGAAPPAGQTLSMDPAFIVATARSAGVLLAIPLDQPILVTRMTGNAQPANAARAANPARQAGSPQGVAGEILVLVRDVPRGGVIMDADIGWATPKTPNMRGLDQDAVIGMEAKRLLKAGNPVQTSDIKAAAVIRKGDPVSLVYLTDGVRLTVVGVAQNEAARGEAVRVLNSYSKRTIEAVAHGPGEARVR